jgi:hypothetical protein
MPCKKPLALLFFVALAVALPASGQSRRSLNTNTINPALSSASLADSQEPGSVLVFPLFETSTVPAPPDGPYGATTTLPKSSFEISVACPNGSTCFDGQDVDIHLEWVCGGNQTFVCQEKNFLLNTTVNGTIRFNPNGGQCEPAAAFQNLEGCGPVPVPRCAKGYLIAWVVNESGQPIKFDGLIGDAQIRESSTAVTAYNAITIQAASSLATGAVLPTGPSGALQFNGSAYQAVTGTIIGSVQYDFINPATLVDQDTTDLVLLTLDTLSNRPNYPTFVDLNFYDEIENVNSVSTAFVCFEETNSLFSDFGLTSATNTPKGLVQSTRAEKSAVLGITDTAGPVTLLGLVVTRECDPLLGCANTGGNGNTLRHFAYPLSNDSIPVATKFVP